MSSPARFIRGQSVILRSTLEMGQVQSDPVRDGGEFWYRVRFVKRIENVVEDDLDSVSEAQDEIESLAMSGQWGRVQAFRTALAVERITQENRSTVYSYRSQRILFEPHQYKPLLKILDSPDRRLLIADQVGLGKTIEAGLILAEIAARRPLERVLVVCPSRLRDKWREEMSRKFDQPFDIFDKRAFVAYADHLHQSRHPKRLRAIMSLQSLRSEELRDLLTAEIGHIDVAIVDEAHHARNPGTQATALLQDVCSVSDYVILLTATPLHLGSRDLFTLLNALRPTEFRDAEFFDRDLRRHALIHEAALKLRGRAPEAIASVIESLQRLFVHTVRPEHRNPLATLLIDDLTRQHPMNRREWIEIERRVQDLHPLASIVTRTKKRDVQENAPTRSAHTYRCPWSPQEDEAYQRLVGEASSLGWIRESLSFGQLQRARQASSCLPAAVLSRTLPVAVNDDQAVEVTDIAPSECGLQKAANETTVDLQTEWEDHDSKYDRFREILASIWEEEPDAKVLVFTFFVGTSKYLLKRLLEEGVDTLRIAGDVPSNPYDARKDIRGECMRRFREDPLARVMVSTEVGSEGLDFQFCHHLINYDLPWNPMVVEQRIGRIDRFGQTSDKIVIHNLVVKGTVEDRILERLYDRIGLFRQSVGDLETILGETVSDLQREYVTGRLTPEEAEQRVEQAARAVEQRRLNLEQLETTTGELFGHEEYIRDEMARVNRLGRFVSEEAMLAVIRSFFEAHHPDVRIWEEATGIYGCSLTDSLKLDMQDAARGGPSWVRRARDDRFLFTTLGEVAFQRSDVELINVSHPLVKAAVAGVKGQLERASARVGQASLEIDREEDPEAPLGMLILLVFAHHVEGLRSRLVFETVAWSESAGRLLESEDGERFLHLVLDRGREWDSPYRPPRLTEQLWNTLVSEARKRNRRLREQEARENEALYARRLAAVTAEYEHEKQSKRNRLRTAEQRGHDRIIRAMRGQLEKADSEFRAKVAELESMKSVQVRLSDPLAACIVEIRQG